MNLFPARQPTFARAEIADGSALPSQVRVRAADPADDYFLVITPTTAPVIDEIRDAYLAYTLDPLSFKYKTVILTKKALQKYSDAAPALDTARRIRAWLLG